MNTEMAIDSLWRRAISVAAMLVTSVSASAAQDLDIGPDFYSGRHATYLTIVVHSPGPNRPPMMFFSRRDARGTPDVVIDRRGLVEGGVVRCVWWNPESLDSSSGLPLRLATAPARPEAPCANGISTGHFTFGPPVLFVLVRRVQGTVAEIPYNGKTLYLDLNALPGDPRDENPEALESVCASREPLAGNGWIHSRRRIDAYGITSRHC
jgi:hypothetical protein